MSNVVSFGLQFAIWELAVCFAVAETVRDSQRCLRKRVERATTSCLAEGVSAEEFVSY